MGALLTSGNSTSELCTSFPTRTDKNFMLHHAVTSFLDVGFISSKGGWIRPLSEMQRAEESEP